MSSVGILNQLGRPKLETLAVLVRETVQNSWDARIADHVPVSYMVHGWEMLLGQRQVLRNQVFSERPAPESLPMEVLDGNAPLYGLIIADRGTRGLAGPTRADIVPEGSERNFISFLRDVGQPSNQSLSGGTYGYGKASLYLTSGLRTILVHTRCKTSGGKFESRFIAASLGQRWADEKHRQFTGRHWWGTDGGDVAEPVLNRDADQLAESLGMGGFESDETGTTILILDPLLNDRTSEKQARFEAVERTPVQALNLMAEYALKFFWPKMLENDAGFPAVSFRFSWEDHVVKLPRPSEFPPLAGFVEAMERLKGRRSDDAVLRIHAKDIASERPRKHLGKLVLQQFILQKAFTRLDTGSSESPFDSITHHTALMRQAELVVKYLEGRPPASSSIGYAGVFIADADVDDVFAKSEPPTHDEWSPDSLTESWHKTYVRVALRKISEEMMSFAQTPRTAAPVGTLTPLGAFATWLGETLIPMEIGTSANRPRQRPNIPLPNFLVRSDAPPSPLTTSASPTFSTNGGTQMSEGLLGINTGPAAPTSFSPESHLSDSTGTSDAVYPSKEPVFPRPMNTPADSCLPPAPTLPTNAQETSSPKPVSPRKVVRGNSAAEIIHDELVEYEGRPALLVTFDVRHAENADGTTIKLHAQAVLDSDVIEDEPPLGGSTAQAARWVSPAGEVFLDSDGSIFIAVSQPREKWQVLVLLPDDMMVSVELDTKAEVLG
jgi:hypothetical protein